MIATQMSIFHRAVNHVLELPLEEDGNQVAWMFVCTSGDGETSEGDPPTMASLTVVPSRARLNDVLLLLGGVVRGTESNWELVPVPDGNPLHVRVDGNLEITVVEEL